MATLYTFDDRTLQLAFKAKEGKVATCTLSAYVHKVDVEMSSDDFIKLQVSGLFDKKGRSVVFNNHSVTGEL